VLLLEKFAADESVADAAGATQASLLDTVAAMRNAIKDGGGEGGIGARGMAWLAPMVQAEASQAAKAASAAAAASGGGAAGAGAVTAAAGAAAAAAASDALGRRAGGDALAEWARACAQEHAWPCVRALLAAARPALPDLSMFFEICFGVE
jgi:hypothetical protein